MQSNTDEKVPSSSFLLFENYHIFSLRTVRKHFHQNQPFAIRKSHYKCSNYLIATKIIILKNTCFALFVWQHQKGLFYIIYKVYCIYATLPLKTFLCSAGFGVSWDFFFPLYLFYPLYFLYFLYSLSTPINLPMPL